MGRVLQGGINRHDQATGQPLAPRVIHAIGHVYARWTREAWALETPGGSQSVRRMRDHQEAVLLFVRDPRVPPTNNLAERAIRPEKTRMKTSGCHRIESGAHNRAVMMEVLGTARRQGWNPRARLP